MTRKVLIKKPGVYADMKAADYFAEPCPEPALSNSGIKILLGGTPEEFHYHHPALNPDGEDAQDSAAKRFGDVGHQIALGKGRGYAVAPWETFASADAKAFKADAIKAGLTPIVKKKFDEAKAAGDRMRQRFELHLQAMNGGKLPKYETEVVAAWQEETRHGPIWCRIMMDVFCFDLKLIRDPKFTKRLADGVFESHASSMSWDFQAEWYLRGMEKLFPKDAGRWRFVNDCISPDPPYVHRIREADEATRYSCRIEIERAIDKFASCLHSKSWPGYPLEIVPWTAKSYTMADRMARAEMEEFQ